MAKVLTARTAEATKPDPDRRREIPDGGLPGLYLVVQPSGAKSWAVRYRLHGNPKKYTLGAYPKITLGKARTLAGEALKLVDAGIDPATVKKARRDADSIEALAEDFLTRHADKKKSGAETRRIFEREVLPVWRGRKAGDITRRDVIDLLDGIVDRGAPFMANRTLAAIRKLFNWALSRDRLPASPCAGVKPPVPERTRDRILTDEELRAFWASTGRLGYPFGPLFRLLLLTGQRRDEVGAMRWREIDGAAWSIPGDRTKNGEPHLVHLSDPALVALASVPRIKGTGYAFTTSGETAVSGWSRAKTRIDAMMAETLGAEVPAWRLHDLRRTCASGMARAGIDLPVIERCLNHVSGSFAGVAGVYNRFSYAERSADAWNRWGALVLDLAGERAGAVVPLKGAEK